MKKTVGECMGKDLGSWSGMRKLLEQEMIAECNDFVGG